MAVVDIRSGIVRLNNLGTYRNKVRRNYKNKVSKGKLNRINPIDELTGKLNLKLAINTGKGMAINSAANTVINKGLTAAGVPVLIPFVHAGRNLYSRIKEDQKREKARQLQELLKRQLLSLLQQFSNKFIEFSNKINSCLDKLNFALVQSDAALMAFKNLTIWKNKLDRAKYNLKVAKSKDNPVLMESSLSQIDQAKLNIAKYLNMYNQLRSD